MDISNEARVDPFSIGPSSIVGRILALRVLFSISINQIRLQITQVLRRIISTAASWLHPRNTQGILLLVTVAALFLRRFAGGRSEANASLRRRFWRNLMKCALTYEEWAHAAKMLDKEMPRVNESEFYDEELVRCKLRELRQRREEGSLRDIVFCMRADLMRNLGNMCSPQLHNGRLQEKSGMKRCRNVVENSVHDTRKIFLPAISICNESRHHLFTSDCSIKVAKETFLFSGHPITSKDSSTCRSQSSASFGVSVP